MVSILVGLVIKKTPVIGIVYIPVLDQMYTAIRGRGAYMNNKKLQVLFVINSSAESLLLVFIIFITFVKTILIC